MERVSSPEALIGDIIAFNGFGKGTITSERGGIPYFINEFWTSKQRQSNSLHEISYRACFKAQLPEFFISRLTRPGDVVLDPFMGRGTTPVQAGLMGRRPFGNDVNPLSVLLTRPRLQSIDIHAVSDALSTVDWSRGQVQHEDLLAFYHPETLRKIEALRLWISERAPLGSKDIDPIADWIRMVAINRLSGHSPGFFSGRTMPPNQAVSVSSQLKINEKLGITPPERDISQIILKKTRSLLKNSGMDQHVRSLLMTGTAWDMPDVRSGSVDLTVTSPPFLDIVQYAEDNWLRCWFAGIDPGSVKIDIHKTEVGWQRMVTRVLREQARIIRPGGYVAFEVGEVRSGKVLLEELVWRAAEGLPFERLGVMVNDQKFTKTANCWGVDNRIKGTNTNRIVLLHKT